MINILSSYRCNRWSHCWSILGRYQVIFHSCFVYWPFLTFCYRTVLVRGKGVVSEGRLVGGVRETWSGICDQTIEEVRLFRITTNADCIV